MITFLFYVYAVPAIITFVLGFLTGLKDGFGWAFASWILAVIPGLNILAAVIYMCAVTHNTYLWFTHKPNKRRA